MGRFKHRNIEGDSKTRFIIMTKRSIRSMDDTYDRYIPLSNFVLNEYNYIKIFNKILFEINDFYNNNDQRANLNLTPPNILINPITMDVKFVDVDLEYVIGHMEDVSIVDETKLEWHDKDIVFESILDKSWDMYTIIILIEYILNKVGNKLFGRLQLMKKMAAHNFYGLDEIFKLPELRTKSEIETLLNIQRKRFEANKPESLILAWKVLVSFEYSVARDDERNLIPDDVCMCCGINKIVKTNIGCRDWYLCINCSPKENVVHLCLVCFRVHFLYQKDLRLIVNEVERRGNISNSEESRHIE